jgi:hypothetical protein
MSRRAQVVVLCEDKQQDVFFYRLLRRMGYTERQIRVVPYPHGEADAKAHVRTNYPPEVAAQRDGRVASDLVGVADVDRDDLDSMRRALDGSLPQPRQPNERIALFLPKRCIETWIGYLMGDRTITEETRYPRRLRREESKCAPAVVEYYRMAAERQDSGGHLPSLDTSFAEYGRLRQP